MVEVGTAVANISFPTTSNPQAQLTDYRGQRLILYFYPKDATPGCTTEAGDFRDNYAQFQARQTAILGVSRDSLASHEKFKQKLELPFDLASDEDESLCQLFDVIKEKNMYGKKHLGIERSTFIIDENGILTHAFRKVRVKGHVEMLLNEQT